MDETSSARRMAFSLVLVFFLLLPFVLFLGPQYLAAREQGLGREAAKEGDFLGAARYLATAAAFRPDEPGLWEAAGLYAWQGGDAPGTIRYLARAQDRGQLAPETRIVLGDAYEAVGDYSQATRTWRAILDQSGPTLPLLDRMVSAHRAAADQAALAQDLELLVRLQPDGDLFLELGLLLAVSKPDQALGYLAQAGVADPALLEVTDALDRTIRRARLIDEDPAFTLTEVGRRLAALGEWSLAEEAFKNAVGLNPEYAEARAYLAEARQQNGKDGLAELDAAYALAPDNLVVNTVYALYAQRQGRYDQAVIYLQAALDADPANPTLLAEMAGTLSAQGDVQTAIDLLIQAADQDRQNPIYWRLLALFSIQNLVQVTEIGLPAARQALLLDPDNPAASDLVGQAYLAMENPLLAERFFLQAAATGPEYAPAYLHLGMLYLTTGDTAEARRVLEQVLVLAPGTDLYEKALNLLDLYVP